ncbi:hypothetical protein EVAR_66679_1 [Eumeta japonica]|uniref:Uncharacterized protein n=1 Tax=Eumeta variegata TaxID=151549 RepID=A0A4C1ZG40_EUMVA|nr:hypothetical protein EVAR_66679_1 [Eumeta japonica]
MWSGPPGHRSRDRPKARWKDEKETIGTSDWPNLAKNYDKWQYLEEAFNRRGTRKAEILQKFEEGKSEAPEHPIRPPPRNGIGANTKEASFVKRKRHAVEPLVYGYAAPRPRRRHGITV